MGLRITTWNVNGLRNPFSYQPWRDKRSFVAMFDILEADIVVLQETKIQRKDLRDDMVLVPGWDCYFSFPKHEKGKFGVVIYTRQAVCAPIKAEEGITGILCPPNSSTSFRDLPESQCIGGYTTEEQALDAPDAPDIAADFATLDSEGRCVLLEFSAFVLVGVYNPATRDSTRNAFRIGFLNLLETRIRNLVALGKRVVLAGDLNIAKAEIDMANCEADLRKAGITIQEYFSRPARRMLNQLVGDGEIWGVRDTGREIPVLNDLCRTFHPSRKGMFTCWETKINARPGNYGSRIDYILCSIGMKDWFREANIQEGLMGSDHCPVYAVIKDKVLMHGEEVDIHDLMNPPGMFREGRRMRDYSTKDMQPLSGKLIAEFNGRRSIKDMLSKKLNAPSLAGVTAQNTVFSDPSQMLVKNPQILHVSDKTLPKGGTQLPADSQSQDPPFDKSIRSPRAKRQAPDLSLKKNSKRARSQAGSAGSAAITSGSTKGQQSLVGFFKPKGLPSASPTDIASKPGSTNVGDSIRDCEPNSIASLQEIRPFSEGSNLLDANAQPPKKSLSPPQVHRPSATDEPVFDPIESKESWSKLFSKPVAPLCEGHSEPCKTMTTKKPGANCGRSFWMCAKPLGPSGQTEKKTQWRCPTFIWCSDFRVP